MTVLYGTGFEAGSKEIISSGDAGDISDISVLVGSVIHGAYGMRISDAGGGANWVRFGNFDAGYTELYMSCYLDPRGASKGFRIEFELTDGALIGIGKKGGISNQEVRAYVDGGEAEISSTTTWTQTDTLVEMYVKIDSVVGRILAKKDGEIAIDYTDDTKPTAATDIKYIRFSLTDGTSDFFDIDDVTVKDDSLPGDVIYINSVPTSDDTSEWTPSSGGTNWPMVDERPPSDADYVSAAINNRQDLYGHSSFSLTKAISHIVQWVRGYSSVAGGEYKIQIKSGSTTSELETSGLGTSAEYIGRVVEFDPATGAAWGIAAFDASLMGQQAVTTVQTVYVTQHILEIAYSDDVSVLTRPLSLDVDLAEGLYAWVTLWDDGTIFLKRMAKDLSTFGLTNFAAATEAEIENRTYYMAPYCPPFFDLGTAVLREIVYVFGRWDDGTVRHIAKSTDAGASFQDIGDSATWTTRWVGAFFATDSNNLFAFLNGTGRAMFVSTDGGTTWTQQLTLPFDVGAASLGADGKILIINRDAGAQMAAYAEGPDYFDWVDATGNPAFPQSGGGSNAVAWIT